MKKGSKEAKAHMAKLRSMKGKKTTKKKKTGSVSFMAGGKKVSFKARR